MKKITIAYALAFLAVILAGVGSFAADKEKYGFYVAEPREKLCGTWVNKGYSGVGNYPQKWTYYHWGYYEVFAKTEDRVPFVRGTSMIIDKWTDSEGNIWIKEYQREDWTTLPLFTLDKISEDGSVIDFAWSHWDFPTESDLFSENVSFYCRKYYRQ